MPRAALGPLTLAIALCSGAPPAAPDALPPGDVATRAARGNAKVVRVLLLASDGAVELQAGPGGSRTRVEPASHGLRAGSRSLGSRWRLEGAGPLSAAGLRVRGSLEVHRVPEGLWVVNRVPLEHYVAGTVGREVYANWEQEALKAQAVVARTYVLHRAARQTEALFDVEGGTSGQVYGGVDAESPSVVAAARATRGEILTHRGEPILAVYHSAAGGRTASAAEVWGRPLPYLVSVPVKDEEDSPDTYWRASVTGTTLGRALAPFGIRVGPVHEVRIVERSPSGRAHRVWVRGTEGDERVAARTLRTALGESEIRSTLFEIRGEAGRFVFVGSGHGHGVGMSQWGAQAMAKAGASYREILEMFYPGTALVEVDAR